ncbi:MAG: Rieske 2Fe-2S domain-containing protein [Burkholderiales bacterium]
MSFVRNSWYVAAFGNELGSGLLARTILGEPVVLYRTPSGKPVAMLDRCPHRLLPLSKGCLKDEGIECGYHGLTFDHAGKCIVAPGQTRIPDEARVRTYPVAEHMGMVWIWPGDPALADTAKIFDRLPRWADSQVPGSKWDLIVGEPMHVKGNYLLLCENLVDPAHVVYVHKRTLGSPAMVNIPIEAAEVDGALLVSRWTPNAPASPMLQRYGKWPGNVDRWQYYWFYAPNIAVVDFGAGEPGMARSEEARDAAVRLYSAHFMTPETEESTYYFWFVLRNFGVGDAAVSADLMDQVTSTFLEDKVVLEAIQAAEAAPFVTKRVKLAIDSGSARLRRTVARMVAAEETAPVAERVVALRD